MRAWRGSTAPSTSTSARARRSRRRCSRRSSSASASSSSTQEQTREGRRIAEVAAEIEALTRQVRDTTDVQRKAAEETLTTLGVFRATAQEAAQESATLHGLVEMLSARSAALAKQIDRFELDDGAEDSARVRSASSRAARADHRRAHERRDQAEVDYRDAAHAGLRSPPAAASAMNETCSRSPPRARSARHAGRNAAPRAVHRRSRATPRGGASARRGSVPRSAPRRALRAEPRRSRPAGSRFPAAAIRYSSRDERFIPPTLRDPPRDG